MPMNYKETFKFVDDMMEYPDKDTIILVGPYGTGKSTLLKSVARKREAGFVDRRLSQDDVGDLKGMPFFFQGRTYFAPPEWYPMCERDILDLAEKLNIKDTTKLIRHLRTGILCLDEMDRAVQEVRQASFELILDRSLGGRPILPDWLICGGINADGDVYQVNELDVSHIDRVVFINFRPTVTEWLDDFARGPGAIHEVIVNFITTYTELLEPTKDIILAHPGQKLYSRRSWEKFSKFLRNYTALETRRQSGLDLLDAKPESLARLSSIAEGYVGEKTAGAFRNYVASNYRSLSADMIVNKWGGAVEKEIRKLIENKDKAIELTALPKLVVHYMEDQKYASLTEDQQHNLVDFLCILPKEHASSFFQYFNAKCKTLSEKWFTGKFKAQIAPKVREALQNPATQK
jgi:hypothetical protein